MFVYFVFMHSVMRSELIFIVLSTRSSAKPYTASGSAKIDAIRRCSRLLLAGSRSVVGCWWPRMSTFTSWTKNVRSVHELWPWTECEQAVPQSELNWTERAILQCELQGCQFAYFFIASALTSASKKWTVAPTPAFWSLRTLALTLRNLASPAPVSQPSLLFQKRFRNDAFKQVNSSFDWLSLFFFRTSALTRALTLKNWLALSHFYSSSSDLSAVVNWMWAWTSYSAKWKVNWTWMTLFLQ